MSTESNVMQSVLSTFDVDAFLLAEYTEATEVNRTLFPIGEIRVETIKDFELIKPRLWKNPDTQEQVWMPPQLRLHMLIKDQGVLDQINARGEDALFRYAINLEVNEEKKLDMGPNRNIALGQLRAAIGQNVEGTPWGIMNLKGCRPFGIVVAHRAAKNNPETLFENVTKWFNPDVSDEAA